jgi:hypothetical protein
MTQTREEREALRREYRELFQRVSEILFAEDPVGINFEENTDEYEPEVGTILPRLKECRTVHDLRKVLHQEFVHWFGASTAGPETNYQRVAELIWAEVVKCGRLRA